MRREEAARKLGIHYVSLLRLIRNGVIILDDTGEVDAASMREYDRLRRMPDGYMDHREAAEYLGVPARSMAKVAKSGEVKVKDRLEGGWWFYRRDIAALKEDPIRLAAMGVYVQPPDGWITLGEAAAIIGCSPSWVARLSRRNTIRRMVTRHGGGWYNERDVRRYAELGELVS